MKKYLYLILALAMTSCGLFNEPEEKNKPATTEQNGGSGSQGSGSGSGSGDSSDGATVRLSHGKLVDGHYLVDMGQAGEWATCNLGANAPEEEGNHYAWGEIKAKKDFTWANYRLIDDFTPGGMAGTFTFLKYTYNHAPYDNKYYLDAEDDAATVNWGENYRIPNQEEWLRLFETCSPKYIQYKRRTDNPSKWVEGILFTAKNGNTLFLPCIVELADDYTGPDGFGDYWTSALANGKTSWGNCRDYFAFSIQFTEDIFIPTNAMERYFGMGVRAIRRIPTYSEPVAEPEPLPSIPIIN